MASKEKHSVIPGKAVWLITGCSIGFGQELAKTALERGYRTVVTSSDIAEAAFVAGNAEALALELDVTDQVQVDAAVQTVEDRFGGIDVLVNNAGIGNFAAIEETRERQLRRMFDINVFGMSRMIQAALPGMRKRHSGVIVNFSSSGGLRSFPSVSYYNATKFAVESLSDTLGKELEPLGIRVMFVEPSGFGGEFAEPPSDEGQLGFELATAIRQARADATPQPEDPARAARAMVKAIELPNPPQHLLLGNEAYYCTAARPAASLIDAGHAWSWG
jgi:NAD(P)-dependent dehydrogenase (short-subunit alcohol dehydrogenase family)